MEIFGIPVYLNFLSLTCAIPVLLGWLGAFFVGLIRYKSPNTWAAIFSFFFMGFFQLGYTLATSVFDAVGAYHRLLTIGSVFAMQAAVMYFIMSYSEDTHPRLRRWGTLSILLITPLSVPLFAIRGFAVGQSFSIHGQFWDFNLPIEGQSIGALILGTVILIGVSGYLKFRKMVNRRNARTFIVILFAVNAYTIPGAVMNNMWRKGLITPETHLWFMAIGISLSFFIIFVVFLSHTTERSTVIGNLLGITLVSVLILIPFLAYPLIEDRKASFREIWTAKLQAQSKALTDKNIVFLFLAENSRTYFRDNPDYYRNALKAPPADGVILRADARGGVYTFPVTIVAPVEVTRNTGNDGQEKTSGDFTRHSGKPGGTTLKPTTYLAGIELVELRKYIHPTAAKLVLAQFVVILVIVSLFPLFFRGILLSPMRRLLDGVIAISRGRYGHRIENFRSDELGVISRHFDKMAVTIEASTTKLEDTVAQRTAQLTEEKKKSDTLLLNILPRRIAEELKEKGQSQPVRIDSATVLFTDFVGFTKISETLTPEEVVAELDKCFSYFDQVTEKYRLEKLKTIGDSFMCAGGLPTPNKTHAIDCCLAALEIQAFMNQMKEIKHQQGFDYWELRLGMNTGPLVAGVVGHKKFAYDVWGDTVNTASRLESSGVPGKINIALSTYELVKDFFDCEHRGQVKAKNKGDIDMYFLNGVKRDLSVNGEGRVPNEKFREIYKTIMKGRNPPQVNLST